MIYSLIRNNQVENTIVADPRFIEQIQKDYDQIILISDPTDPKAIDIPLLNAPGIQDAYDARADTFTKATGEVTRRDTQNGKTTFQPVVAIVDPPIRVSRLMRFLTSFTLKA